MDIDTVLRKLRPLLGEDEVNRLWQELQIADAKTRQLLEFSIRNRLKGETGTTFDDKHILLEPIPKERAAGDITLGTVLYGKRPLHPFSLRRGELIQHMAIFGRSGAGKTNVAFLLLRELAKLKIPFLVTDWKRNYRDLLFHTRFKNLVVYTVGRGDAPFFFNPLIPPKGVHPTEWLKKLIEIMQHAFFLGDGVAFVLQEAIDELYREFDIYDEPKKWPTFRDLARLLRNRPVKGREAQWMESTKRAVGVLTFGAANAVVNSGAHVPIETLLTQQAILELDALTNDAKTFLIEALLLWIHHHRMGESGREKLKHVLLIEEAHHILVSKKQQVTGTETITDLILREIREFGEAIVLLDQLPSLISKPALANTYSTICLNVKEKGNITAASKVLLLESEEYKWLGQLPVGTAITKLQDRWQLPFLVSFPSFTVTKGSVTNEQVARRYQDSLDMKTALTLAQATLDGTTRLLDERLHDYQAKQKETAEAVPQDPLRKQLHDPGAIERRTLSDIHRFPLSTVTERYGRLAVTRDKGTRVINTLVESGYLKSVKVAIPGATIRLLELTPAGRRALDIPEDTKRWGGVEHRYWVETIAEYLRGQDVEARTEARFGKNTVADILVATLEKDKIAIQVETGKSDWKANAGKCLLNGASMVIIVTTTDAPHEAIEQEAERQAWPRDRWEVVPAKKAIQFLQAYLWRL